ncbi:LysR family transcriptional regulator [Bradyrhizobium sp. DOA9]|uniref:LysR family transcriptional regulator n=1 Tax=Bradyrhizobium sp. DOA9 TaxID=1126627 RepID=UPI000469F045|nr:LysR family transcriptional regulator [Bradyrhizobium sp. DOA9]GAJ37155.1 putative HTH-type transcriptional regulator HI1364 [Bradyrhizobium sp. DOA9]
MLDRLTSLEVFAKVAAAGSLSGAARAMNLSQTMVTKHVASLEARLGTKLFHRTTRRLSITEAGRSYLESAERILADMEAADAAIARERIEPRGLLRVNVPVVFGTRQIAPAIAEFSAAHPEVTVELGLNDRLVDLAEEGWDLAIRIGSLRDSSMVARKLAPNRLVVCAAPSYLARHGTPRSVADLAGHNCLGYTLSQQASAAEWLFGAEGEIRVQVNGTLRANNGDALRAATLSGLGLARQPTFIIADDLRSGALVTLPLDQPEIQTSAVHAVYLPDRRPPAKVRAFIDFLAARFAPVAPWDRGLP